MADTTGILQLIHKISGRRLDNSITDTGGVFIDVTETVAASVTDQLVTVAFDVSLMQQTYMICDQAISVQTNNATSPVDTFALLAGEPLIWWAGSLYTNLWTTDVTAIYLTTGSIPATANFSLTVLVTS